MAKVVGGICILLGLFLIFTPYFFGGVPAICLGAYVCAFGWRSSDGWKGLFFHGPLQLLLNISLILLILTRTMGTFMAASDTKPLVDFAALYVGGYLARTSPQDLYEEDAQLLVERRITGLDVQPDEFLPYPYPPFMAFFLAPFSLLDYEGAFRAQVLFNLALLAASVFLMAIRLSLKVAHLQCLVLFCTAAMPVYVTFLQGQTSFIALFLVTCFSLDFLSGRNRSGLWLGLLFFKPQFVVVPAALLLGKRRWGAMLCAAATAVLLAGFSWWLVGWEGLRSWQSLLDKMASGAQVSITFLSMQNLRAVVRYVQLSDSVWLGLVLALLLHFLWRQASLRPIRTLWSAVLLLLLISPHLYLHDLSLTILCLALVLSTCEGNPSRFQVMGYFGLGLLPLATLFLWALTGTKWPVLPLTLLVLYCLSQKREDLGSAVPGTAR